jgi:hypothetical protein
LCRRSATIRTSARESGASLEIPLPTREGASAGTLTVKYGGNIDLRRLAPTLRSTGIRISHQPRTKTQRLIVVWGGGATPRKRSTR